MSSLIFIAQQINIYCGLFIFFAGVSGGILNIIVFLSLKTFRENSCSFYLIIMSIVNVGQLFAGPFTRIMINGFDIDWTQSSLFYCKFRNSFLQLCLLTSFSCISFATIDQFLATCSNRRRQKWCHIKVAYILSGITIIIWILHGIPYLIYYDHIVSSISGKIICSITNDTFQKYVSYIYAIVYIGIVPVVITSLFGILAYRNTRQLAHRTVPLVRRELDKQLTIMILVQGIFNFWFLVPYVISNGLTLNTSLTQDSDVFARLQFSNSITLIAYYLYFASPFYIYVCVSKRFRQQLIHVLHKLRWDLYQRQEIATNQVMPQL